MFSEREGRHGGREEKGKRRNEGRNEGREGRREETLCPNERFELDKFELRKCSNFAK